MPKKKPLRAKRDRYRVDTYVEDGIEDYRYTVTSYHPTLKEARAEAIKEEKYQKNLMDHSMVHIDSAIASNRKKFKLKKKKKDKPMFKSKNDSYSKGKHWGFAVASASISSGKNGVYKADRAMQTCAKNARSGTKKLNVTERQAYQGMADGIYDALKSAERKSQGKPKAKRK